MPNDDFIMSSTGGSGILSTRINTHFHIGDISDILIIGYKIFFSDSLTEGIKKPFT